MSTQKVEHRCCGIASKADSKEWEGIREMNYYQCTRKATVCRDGKWYCWQHDPVAFHERLKKRDEERRQKQKEQLERRERSFEAYVAEEKIKEDKLDRFDSMEAELNELRTKHETAEQACKEVYEYLIDPRTATFVVEPPDYGEKSSEEDCERIYVNCHFVTNVLEKLKAVIEKSS